MKKYFANSFIKLKEKNSFYFKENYFIIINFYRSDLRGFIYITVKNSISSIQK